MAGEVVLQAHSSGAKGARIGALARMNDAMAHHMLLPVSPIEALAAVWTLSRRQIGGPLPERAKGGVMAIRLENKRASTGEKDLANTSTSTPTPVPRSVPQGMRRVIPLLKTD